MLPKFRELNKIGKISYVLMIAISLAFATSLISYAYYSSNKEQQGANVISSACFSLEFTEQTDAINLTNTYPMTKEKAYTSKNPYTFTITNKCNTDMYYNITLNTTGNDNLENYLTYELLDSSDNVLSTNLISNLSTYSPYNDYNYTEDNVNFYSIKKSYILNSGMLAKAVMGSDNTTVVTPGESKQFKLYIWMNSDITNEEAMGKNFTGKVIVTSSTNNVSSIKCKRADVATLHTEKCMITDSSGCRGAGIAQGEDITYGNATTTNGTLTTGDAFDCDINSDSYFDPQNERFYYVSTKDNGITQDTSTAVLIWSKDYVTSTVAWAPESSATGPISAIVNLPTINDWTTKLTSVTRDVTLQNNTVRAAAFQYKKDDVDLAARLITYQEINNGCYNGTAAINTAGGLDSCTFLLEGTTYTNISNPAGTWLETAHSGGPGYAWRVNGGSRWVYDMGVNVSTYETARPAIEVSLKDIRY